MSNSNEQYQKSITRAIAYGKKVIFSITKNKSLHDDLIQELSYELLSRPEKYAAIIDYKVTVFNILKGKYINSVRKMAPEYHQDITTYGNEHHYSNQQASLDDKTEEHLDSILFNCFQPNGRKGAVHSYASQKAILAAYKKTKITQRVFCKEMGISTLTLNKLLTQGPQEVKEPLRIRCFKMYHIHGMSFDEIADSLGIKKHAVNQHIYMAKKKIKAYLAVNDPFIDLEPVHDVF